MTSGGRNPIVSRNPSLVPADPLDEHAATFDTAHAVQFLDAVLGDCWSGRIGVCAIGNGPIRHAHFQWIREAVQQAEAWDKQKPVGVYSG